MLRTAVAILLVLFVAGCDSGSGSTTLASIDPETATTAANGSTTSVTVSQPPSIPEPLASFGVTHVELDGSDSLVAVADEPGERRQGLMNLEDLLDLDGMIFVFDDDVSAGFWMKNTLIPLDIAFFTAEGDFVDGFVMDPCTENPCPTYQPAGAYRYALEMPAGTMPDEVQHIVVDR